MDLYVSQLKKSCSSLEENRIKGDLRITLQARPYYTHLKKGGGERENKKE
jgi:hypothetical protein